MYKIFVTERIKGPMLVWTPLKKRKLKTFQSHAKVVNYEVREKIVQMKEERTLIARFLIMSRQREEISIQSIIGNYELAVIPQFLFIARGQRHPCLDKSKIISLNILSYLKKKKNRPIIKKLGAATHSPS